jgi:hypothetical protein
MSICAENGVRVVSYPPLKMRTGAWSALHPALQTSMETKLPKSKKLYLHCLLWVPTSYVGSASWRRSAHP